MKYFLRNRLKNTQHPMFEKSDPQEIKYRNLEKLTNKGGGAGAVGKQLLTVGTDTLRISAHANSLPDRNKTNQCPYS